MYQALVEIDGPWWGESEAAHLRQLCAVTAAAHGAEASSDDFRIEWEIGAQADPVNLLEPNDGLRILAAGFGLPLVEESNGKLETGLA